MEIVMTRSMEIFMTRSMKIVMTSSMEIVTTSRCDDVSIQQSYDGVSFCYNNYTPYHGCDSLERR